MSNAEHKPFWPTPDQWRSFGILLAIMGFVALIIIVDLLTRKPGWRPVSSGYTVEYEAEPLTAEAPIDADDNEPAEQPVTAGDTITGKVIKIVDGNTLEILDSEKITIRVRLEGIDTPQRGQPFSIKARDKLAELTLSKSVQVHSIGEDRHGRTLGRITADGIDVNLELVRSGLAWHFQQNSARQALADAENEARAAQIGLWSLDADAPVAPCD